MAVSYLWKPIEDLPSSWFEISSPELASLADIWHERSKDLEQSGVLASFNDRLRREWAIETGIIERLYSIDRGITNLLIERGIEASLIPHGTTDKPAAEIVAVLRDHEDVLAGIFDFVSKKRDLSTSYIKELHQAFTRHQSSVQAKDRFGKIVSIPMIRGDWKTLPNNPERPNGSTHEYCPPEHVASEMDRLIAWHVEHEKKQVTPDVEAAWLHHRFTQIHPFQDGNGRVARALASLIFLRAKWFPLVINRDFREQYISALESGDAGKIEPIVKLFVRVQKDAFVRALSISDDALHDRFAVEQVLTAAAERLRTRREAQLRERQKVFSISTSLERTAYENMKGLAKSLRPKLKNIDAGFSTRADASSTTSDHWYRSQIIETARKLGYHADTRTYRSWVKLQIKEDRQTDIVVSFHSLGQEFLGVLVASAFLEFKDRSEGKEISISGPITACQELFQFSYNENSDRVSSRFSVWLNQVMMTALEQWRKQL